MRVLSVAFPFAPVRPDACGGAEQVLAALDAGLVDNGHRSFVLASAESRVRGHLVASPPIAGPIDGDGRAQAWQRHGELVERTVREGIDLVHLHGLDFARYLPAATVPTLATLHLPLDWYPPGLPVLAQHLRLVCVSRSQRAAGGPHLQDLPVIENGVPLPPRLPHAREDFVLCLGRICPEKGFHLAVRAAARAGVPLVLAGQVFPYREHQDYFERTLRPLLDAHRRFIGPVAGAKKQRLLATARCVLVPSLAAETSSLVAMEALAAGTPVIARPVGALPEIVEHGHTGLLATDEHDLGRAIREVTHLDPSDCRRRAAQRFDQRRMVAEYLELYQRLAGR